MRLCSCFNSATPCGTTRLANHSSCHDEGYSILCYTGDLPAKCSPGPGRQLGRQQCGTVSQAGRPEATSFKQGVLLVLVIEAKPLLASIIVPRRVLQARSTVLQARSRSGLTVLQAGWQPLRSDNYAILSSKTCPKAPGLLAAAARLNH